MQQHHYYRYYLSLKPTTEQKYLYNKWTESNVTEKRPKSTQPQLITEMWLKLQFEAHFIISYVVLYDVDEIMSPTSFSI